MKTLNNDQVLGALNSPAAMAEGQQACAQLDREYHKAIDRMDVNGALAIRFAKDQACADIIEGRGRDTGVSPVSLDRVQEFLARHYGD